MQQMDQSVNWISKHLSRINRPQSSNCTLITYQQ